MSDDTWTDDVATAEEFEHALGRLLQSAHENDVDVTGGWDVRADGTAVPNLDVVITAVDREYDGTD